MVIVGGTLSAALLTLYVLPVIYWFAIDLSLKWRARRAPDR